MKILIVEDNKELVELISRKLKTHGFCVDIANYISDAYEAKKNFDYDCIVLDLGLPDGEGLNLIKDWRKANDFVPILVLSANDGLDDRINVLNEGADDYCVKPLDLNELIARIRALGRRPEVQKERELSFGNIRLDTASNIATINQTPCEFRKKELSLLKNFLSNPNKVLSKDSLEQKLYSFDDEISSNSLEVHICRLRKKLILFESSAHIHTVRGLGYLLCEQYDAD
jgi:DNA-binding response OmpR family regulator